MVVSVAVQDLLYGNKTGIGFYQSEILNALSEIDGDNKYLLDIFSFRNSIPDIERAESFLKGGELNICEWFNYGWAKKLWYLIPIPYKIFFPKKSDVSLFFNYFVPPFAHGRSVVMVYDTVVNDMSDTMDARTRFSLQNNLRRSIKRADVVVTISQFSKERIMYHYGVDPDKIRIASCGYREDIFHNNYSSEKIDCTKQKYEITGDYFLYLGTLEPRKNIERLVEAYSSLTNTADNCPKLVIAGGKGWLYDSIFEIVKKYGLESDVIFTGYVEDEEVPLLMNGAMAFCFPSLYEGFGMPPLEAMACGTPVITSNISSLPEVVGDAAVMVDPYSAESICEALHKVLKDEELRKNMSYRGLEQCKKFSWKKSAEIFLDIIKK